MSTYADAAKVDVRFPADWYARCAGGIDDDHFHLGASPARIAFPANHEVTCWFWEDVTDDFLSSLVYVAAAAKPFSLDVHLQYYPDMAIERVTDAGLAYLGRTPTLRELGVFECANVTDKGIGALCRSNSLEALSLYNPNLTDKSLLHISKLKGLKSLVLGSTQLTDDGIAAHLAGLALESLMLQNCINLTDKALLSLAKIRTLRSLKLAVCPCFTDKGIEALAALENLEEFHIWNCPGVSNAGLTMLSRLSKLDDSQRW